MMSEAYPDSACSPRAVRLNLPWHITPEVQVQAYSAEYNPYEAAAISAAVHRMDGGPVVPAPWADVSTSPAIAAAVNGRSSSSRGSSSDNKMMPSDPFTKRTQRWGKLKRVSRFFGIRGTDRRKEENWILSPNPLATVYPFVPPYAPQKPIGPLKIPASAWKEYGHWARPFVEGMEVRNNASPPPDHVLQTVDPVQVFKSLRGPTGSPHPENWVPGIQHPCLPPKPAYWSTPPSEGPMPLPWECRLNPFLEHKRVGLPLVHFDLRLDDQCIVFETGDARWIPLLNTNLNQPATYPFVTEMWITAVADDPWPIFPWPIAVYNSHGVLCKDVFHAIFQNFQKFLTKKEVSLFPQFKRQMVEGAFNIRRDSKLMGKVWDDQDGLRRIDYLVDKVMFRGLEPTVNRGGSWMLFLGPTGPEEEINENIVPQLRDYEPSGV